MVISNTAPPCKGTPPGDQQVAGKPPTGFEHLFTWLQYEPETGIFRWSRDTQCGRARAGGEAGTVNSHGYRHIYVCGRRYYAHRLAWLFMHGRWPAATIDHINGDPLDNRIRNLREATHTQNIQNSRRKTTRNKAGLKGVSLSRTRWRATINVYGNRMSLGTFDNKEDAAAAYATAARKYFGEFARTDAPEAAGHPTRKGGAR
jgi:HNH endonuclease